MMRRLEGKTAIITGGTGGLGTGVLRELLHEGANVISTYIDEQELKGCFELVRDYKDRVVLLRGNLTLPKQAARVAAKTLKEFGRIDVLVHLAGGFVYSTFMDSDAKTFQRMYDINLTTLVNAAKAVLPAMIAQSYGRIVTVSSRPALAGTAGVGAYSASKAAVLNLTQTLAEETIEHGITVNSILPGTIDTPANRRDMPDADFTRWVTPGEIAKVIAFLASDDSKPITGAGIPVYGRS